MMAAGVVLLGASLIAVLAFAGVVGQRGEPRTAPQVSFGLADGRVVDFVRPASESRVVVVNFFASWCPPCRDEAPALRTVWKWLEGKEDVVMVGIIFKDDPAAARSYMKDYDLGFETVEDLGGALARAFRVTGIPKTFVISPTGRVVLVHFGAISAEQLMAAIEEARLQES